MAKKINPPQLVVIEGKEKGKVIALRSGTLVLGRSKGDVIIPDSRISRSHLALHFDDRSGKLTFTDLKSLNGTLINGQPAEKGELLDGDKIQLGNTLLDCHVFPATASDVTESRPEPHFNNDEITHLTVRTNRPTEKPTVLREPSTPKSGLIRSGLDPVKFYQNLRPKARLSMVAVLVLLVFLSFFGSNSQHESADSLDGDIATVRQLASEGKLSEAIIKAENTRRAFPKNPDVHMALGDLHAQRRSLELAIEAYKSAKLLVPKPRLVHLKLAKAYLGAGLISLAQEEMRELDLQIQADPADKELLIETARLILNHNELNQPKDKVLIIAKALQNEIAPTSPIGFKLEAQQLMQQSRLSDALIVLDKALKLAPTDEETLEKVALAKLTMKDSKGAMETVASWLGINPGAPRALLVMGYLKFNDKDYLGALAPLQKLLKQLEPTPKDPFYAEGLNLMGLIYLEQNQRTEAETFLTKACSLGYQPSCNHPLIIGQ